MNLDDKNAAFELIELVSIKKRSGVILAVLFAKLVLPDSVVPTITGAYRFTVL